jgi:hypothetical protein
VRGATAPGAPGMSAFAPPPLAVVNTLDDGTALDTTGQPLGVWLPVEKGGA